MATWLAALPHDRLHPTALHWNYCAQPRDPAHMPALAEAMTAPSPSPSPSPSQRISPSPTHQVLAHGVKGHAAQAVCVPL